MIRVIFACAAMLLLTACATIIKGTTQDLSVNTNPPGANCTVNREGQKIGQVNPTPGLAKVDKTSDDITLVCNKDGYQEATFIVHSGFEAATLGNIAIGGLIGVGIDAATGANNHYDSPANVTLVPAVASAASAAHDASQPTPTIAAAPGSPAKADARGAVQTTVNIARSATPPQTASAPPSSAAATATASPPPPASGTWTAKIHWIPVLLAPRFSGTGESMLAYDVALTNGSIDADKLNIAGEKSNITGTVAGPTIELNGWYKDPWGYVNSVQGSLTENGGAFTGQETCYNTQLAASAPSSQATRHYCNVELSRVP